VLPHQDQRIGEHVETDRKVAARSAHHELMSLQFIPSLLVDRHC
jgi:hypothetical protein